MSEKLENYALVRKYLKENENTELSFFVRNFILVSSGYCSPEAKEVGKIIYMDFSNKLPNAETDLTYMTCVVNARKKLEVQGS